MEDGVVGNMDCFPFTSKGSPTLKYINDVIIHRLEAGMYTQIKKRCFQGVRLAKIENISKTVY